MRLIMLVALLCAVLAGCVEDDQKHGPSTRDDRIELPPNLAVVDYPQLRAAASCAEVEQYIEDTAVLEMRTELVAHRDMALKTGHCCSMTVDAGVAGPGGSGSAGPTSYTGTNNQVAGIEEGDRVKTDGTRMFAVGGQKVQLLSSWPASQLKLASTMAMKGFARELLLDEQSSRLVVFSSEYSVTTHDGRGTTWVTVLDVTNVSAPKVVQRHALPGGYLTSRRSGSSVRFVLRGEVMRPSYETWVPATEGDLPEVVEQRYAALDEQNEQLIRSRALSAWLPAVTAQLTPDGDTVTVPVDCTSILIPNGPTRLGLFTIGTIDLAAPAPPHTTWALTRADEVYASHQTLYITQEHWRWNVPVIPEPDHTYVHKFDLGDPATSTWSASGGFSGKVLDQFSLDEHQGYLRVATTTTAGGQWTNHVRVLQQQGSSLNVVGQTQPLAPGERIYSARFAGEKGFVVTFRQVDPLFTFDLSDPAAPTMLGELKIPGFSTYMQLIDAGHILAVGQENGAVKVSLFDVSNLSAPSEKDSLVLSNWSGQSEALSDHRAFTWSPEQKLLAIPVFEFDYSYHSGNNCPIVENDIRVFEVDPATGITPKGELAMEDVSATACTAYSYYLTPELRRHIPRRSVIADNFLYGISDAAIRVADLSDLANPAATALFP